MTREEARHRERGQWSLHWFNKAVALHGAAGVLWSSIRCGLSPAAVEELGPDHMIGEMRPVFAMLCGMALELLLKAAIVARGDQVKHHHDLGAHADQAGLVLSEKQRHLLEVLSDHIIWHGRYPVPKKPTELRAFSERVLRSLFRSVTRGQFDVLVPTHALDWDSFTQLWRLTFDHYVQASNMLSRWYTSDQPPPNPALERPGAPTG